MKKTIISLLMLFSTEVTKAHYDIDALFNDIEEQFKQSAIQFHQFINENNDSLKKGLKNSKEVAEKIQSRIASYAPNPLLVKIHEDKEKKEYMIEIPVPGFKKGEVTAKLEEINNQVELTITAQSKEETKENKTKSKNGSEEKEIRSSFASSTLTRSFMLPSTVDISSYKATHKNGLFTILFPLKEASKKTIEIKLHEEKK